MPRASEADSVAPLIDDAVVKLLDPVASEPVDVSSLADEPAGGGNMGNTVGAASLFALFVTNAVFKTEYALAEPDAGSWESETTDKVAALAVVGVAPFSELWRTESALSDSDADAEASGCDDGILVPDGSEPEAAPLSTA